MNTTTKPMKNLLFFNLLAVTVVVIAGIATRPVSQRPQPGGVRSADDVRAAIAEAARRRQEVLKPDSALSQIDMAENWGVEVIGIKRAMAGYMLDFRFRVLDLDKAMPLFDPSKQAYLETERSHIKLPVPMAEKIGSFRPTNRGQNIKAGKTYYILFANPDNHVKPDERVSVVIGDFKAEHLTVR